MTEEPQSPLDTTDDSLEEESERAPGIVYRIRSVTAGIWRHVSVFEDRHPWIFFGCASVIVFVIILLVLSSFIGGDDDAMNGIPSTVITTEPDAGTDTDGVTPVASQGTVGARRAIDGSRILTNPDIAFELISPLARLERSGLVGGDTDNPIASLLLSTQQMEMLLEMNIVDTLQSTSDRAGTYESYITQLSQLEKRSGTIYVELTRQHEMNEQEIALLMKKQVSAYNDLNDILHTPAEGNALDSAVELYSRLTAQIAKEQAEDMFLVQSLDSAYPVIRQAQLRLAGMIANKDALIAGITFVDIDGSGLQLEESGALKTFYAPSVDLGDTVIERWTPRSSSDLSPVSPAQPSGSSGLFPNTASSQNLPDALRVTPVRTDEPSAVSTTPLPPLRVIGLEEAFTQ